MTHRVVLTKRFYLYRFVLSGSLRLASPFSHCGCRAPGAVLWTYLFLRGARWVCAALFGLLLSVLFAAHAWAQISGGLAGRVTDPSGAAVAGAQVTLTRMSTGVKRTTESTADGYYTFTQVLPGSYSVEVAAPGFARVLQQGITVATGATPRVDLPLKPGGGQETVTVTEDAPLLQSETSNIQTNIPEPNDPGDPAEHAEFYSAVDAGARGGAATGDAVAAHQWRAAAHE